MDPVAALKRLLGALIDGQRIEARGAAQALRDWLFKGGFMPAAGDIRSACDEFARLPDARATDTEFLRAIHAQTGRIAAALPEGAPAKAALHRMMERIATHAIDLDARRKPPNPG